MCESVITTKEEYDLAMAEMHRLWDIADRNELEEDRFEDLVMEIDLYEEKHYPIALPALADAAQFRQEQMGEQ